jgi:tetratricopeptide (TPR) repeat protein
MKRRFGGQWAGMLLALLVLAEAAGSPGLAGESRAGLERSLLYLQMGLPEMALHELEKTGPAAPEVLLLRGLLLEAAGRPDQAAAVLAEAGKETSPGPAVLTAAVVKTFLGRLLAERGRLEEALGLYREALAADASLGLARLGLAEGLTRLGQEGEALEEYRRFLADNPEDPEALAAAGRLYLATGQTEEARRSLEAALRLNPGLPGVSDTLRRLKDADSSRPKAPPGNG